METFWKILFYLLNFAAYPALGWLMLNLLVGGLAAADLKYWILFLALVFLAVSTISYLIAHNLWGTGYGTMLLRNLAMFAPLLIGFILL